MPKLSTSTEHALSVIAHAIMAKEMAGNVEGFAEFYEFWLKEQPPKDRAIVEVFLKLSTQATKEFSALLAKDLKGSNV